MSGAWEVAVGWMALISKLAVRRELGSREVASRRRARAVGQP